jgi:hypothetical protein
LPRRDVGVMACQLVNVLATKKNISQKTGKIGG